MPRTCTCSPTFVQPLVHVLSLKMSAATRLQHNTLVLSKAFTQASLILESHTHTPQVAFQPKHNARVLARLVLPYGVTFPMSVYLRVAP